MPRCGKVVSDNAAAEVAVFLLKAQLPTVNTLASILSSLEIRQERYSDFEIINFTDLFYSIQFSE